jgi:hypothetical protein
MRIRAEYINILIDDSLSDRLIDIYIILLFCEVRGISYYEILSFKIDNSIYFSDCKNGYFIRAEN